MLNLFRIKAKNEWLFHCLSLLASLQIMSKHMGIYFTFSSRLYTQQRASSIPVKRGNFRTSPSVYLSICQDKLFLQIYTIVICTTDYMLLDKKNNYQWFENILYGRLCDDCWGYVSVFLDDACANIDNHKIFCFIAKSVSDSSIQFRLRRWV